MRGNLDDGFAIGVFALIGANHTFTSITLRPGQRVTLNLEDHGVPKDSKVLDISYTPDMGGLFPVEERGNTPYRFNQEIRHTINLYPIPLRMKEQPRGTRVAVSVTWVLHTLDDEAWQNLVNACRAYYTQQYQAVIIPANVAIEVRLGRLLTAFLENIVSKEHTRNFLTNSATYSHQLNVILPVLTSLKKVPTLPDNIRGHLNRLREHRNDIAHRGVSRKPLEKEDVRDCLCAALFGFHYLNLIARHF